MECWIEIPNNLPMQCHAHHPRFVPVEKGDVRPAGGNEADLDHRARTGRYSKGSDRVSNRSSP